MTSFKFQIVSLTILSLIGTYCCVVTSTAEVVAFESADAASRLHSPFSFYSRDVFTHKCTSICFDMPPKTGTSTLSSTFKIPHDHVAAMHNTQQCDCRFVSVRNPWTRFISMFQWYNHVRRARNGSPPVSIAAFARYAVKAPNDHLVAPFWARYGSFRSYGNCSGYAYVFTTESLDRDVPIIAQAQNLNHTLTTVNVSAQRGFPPLNITDWMGPDEMELISTYYAHDLKFWNKVQMYNEWLHSVKRVTNLQTPTEE